MLGLHSGNVKSRKYSSMGITQWQFNTAHHQHHDPVITNITMLPFLLTSSSLISSSSLPHPQKAPSLAFQKPCAPSIPHTHLHQNASWGIPVTQALPLISRRLALLNSL